MYRDSDDLTLTRRRVRRAQAMRDLERAIDEAFARYHALELRLADFEVRTERVRTALRQAGYLNFEHAVAPLVPQTKPERPRRRLPRFGRRGRRVPLGGTP